LIISPDLQDQKNIHISQCHDYDQFTVTDFSSTCHKIESKIHQHEHSTNKKPACC